LKDAAKPLIEGTSGLAAEEEAEVGEAAEVRQGVVRDLGRTLN
jgi:hypothetical protein